MTRCLLALLLLAATQAGARAQTASCSVSMPSVSFGSVPTNDLSAHVRIASAHVACAVPHGTTYACLFVGSPTRDGRRALRSGANAIPLSVRDAATAAPVGDNASLGAAVAVRVASDKGTVGVNYPLAFSIPALGGTVPPGAYTASFVGPSFGVQALPQGRTDCTGAFPAASSASFVASATVEARCSVTVDDLSFGAVSSVTHSARGVAHVYVSCGQGVSGRIRMDAGQGRASTPRARAMAGPGGKPMAYGLYQDAAATVPWGWTSGIDDMPFSQVGASRVTMPVYGVATGEGTLAPGEYRDTVTVYVEY